MMRTASALGLVLAAGFSRRMGRPKALLRCTPSGETFAARAVRVLREGGLTRVAVVIRGEDSDLRAALERLHPPPCVLVNPAPEAGQLSSLLTGIDHAESQRAEAVVVLPVDMPQIQASSVAALLGAAHGTRTPMLRVVCNDRHGHPVLFRREVFDRLRRADPAAGARAVLHAGAGDVLDVPVDDPGVLRDVDLPAEYHRMFGGEL